MAFSNRGTVPGLVCPVDGVNTITLVPLYDSVTNTFPSLGWFCTQFPDAHNGSVAPIPSYVPTKDLFDSAISPSGAIIGKPNTNPSVPVLVGTDSNGQPFTYQLQFGPPALPLGTTASGIPSGPYVQVDAGSLRQAGVIQAVLAGQIYFKDNNDVLYVIDTTTPNNVISVVPIPANIGNTTSINIFQNGALSYTPTPGNPATVSAVLTGISADLSPITNPVRVPIGTQIPPGISIEQIAEFQTFFVAAAIAAGLSAAEALEAFLRKFADIVEKLRPLRFREKEKTKKKTLDDGILIVATTRATPVNLSQQGKPTQVPPLPGNLGLPGNPDFDFTIAARGFRKALLNHPACTPFTKGPGGGPPLPGQAGVSTTGNPNAFTNLSFFVGAQNSGGYFGPVTQGPYLGLTQNPVAPPPPIQDPDNANQLLNAFANALFTNAAFTYAGGQPGYVGGVPFTPAPPVPAVQQAGLWQNFLGIQVVVINGVVTFLGPANQGWSVTVGNVTTFIDGNSAPVIPPPPAVGTVIASGTFDANGHSPAPDITVLPAYYSSPQPIVYPADEDTLADHLIGPYDGHMNIAISFAFNTGQGGAPNQVIDFVPVTLGVPLVAQLSGLQVWRCNGWTWKNPLHHNDPWSAPFSYLETLDVATRSGLAAGRLGIVADNERFDNQSGLTVVCQFEQIANGRAPLTLWRGRPFGGVQFGATWTPPAGSPLDTFHTHWLQCVGSDNLDSCLYFTGQYLPEIDSTNFLHAGEEVLGTPPTPDATGLFWMVDQVPEALAFGISSQALQSPFYDETGGAASPGKGGAALRNIAFSDIPTSGIGLIDQTPGAQNFGAAARFYPVSPAGTRSVFICTLGCWINNSVPNSLGNNFILSPLFGQGPNTSPIALGNIGLMYQFFAQPSKNGDKLIEPPFPTGVLLPYHFLPSTG